MVNGGIYAISAPVWGYLCDKKLPGKLVTAVGALLIAGSFVFLGPIRIVPFPTTYEVCIAALVAHGVGFAAALVSGKLSSFMQGYTQNCYFLQIQHSRDLATSLRGDPRSR